MVKDIGYRIENLSGVCIKPDSTYVKEIGGKWYVRAKVGEIVFKLPKAFDTHAEAYEQAKRDAHSIEVM